MALNFGLLDTSLPEKIAGSYYAGQQEQQKNMLARQQVALQQQEFGLRQQELEQASQERQAKLQRSAENQKLLTNLSALMEKNGHKLDRPTLGSMLQTGLQTNQGELVQVATKGLQALDEQEQFEAEMGKIKPTPAAPAAANALAPTAQPATAAPTNALAGGYSRPQIESMLTSPNARMREMGGKLLGALPKEVPDTLSQRYVPVGSNVFDRVEQKWIQAPEKAPAPTKTIGNINPNDFTPSSIQKFIDSGKYSDLVPVAAKGGGGGAAAPKAPVGYRFTASGELEPIPGGPAAGKPMTALQQQAFKKDFANDTSKVKSAVTTADELEKLTDELVGNPEKKIAPHPGLGGITGYSALLPSLPSGDAAKAEQKLDTFKGKIKALGRAIASQEGKLGNMAVQEWQMVSDAVQAINPRAGNLDMQMRDVVRQARDLARNMKEKFDLTYEESAPAQGPATVPGRTGAPAVAPAKTKSGATTSNW